MCVTAHPDDEAWAFGGALALYQKRGVETSVIGLTRGGAGTYKGPAKSSAEQKAIRSQEFEAACRILKITNPDLLDYPDGGLTIVNFIETVADLSKRVRTTRPQVVITFGTEGTVTAHPDHTMVALLQTLLKMEGFDVATVDIDSDVAAEVRRERPDYVFLDVHLGRQSGIDIVQAIRKNPEFSKLRIIMTSGLDVRDECLRRGADNFILKPFMPDDLLSLLKDKAR